MTTNFLQKYYLKRVTSWYKLEKTTCIIEEKINIKKEISIIGARTPSGEIKVYKDDEYKMTKPLEKIDIHYPGRGSHNVYVFGHPEAVTFISPDICCKACSIAALVPA